MCAPIMHETEARRLTRIASALGFLWLAMLIGLALTDYLTRVPVPPPWYPLSHASVAAVVPVRRRQSFLVKS